MDAFEQRFAATLKEISRFAPEGPATGPAPSTRPARHHPYAPLLAAAAVAAIVSVGAWQVGMGGNPTGGDAAVPAASQSERPSQVADAPPPASRDAVIDAADQMFAYRGMAGFGTVDVDYRTATVTVFWVGDPPAEVRSLVGERSNGVRVLLEEATFSEAELVAAGTAAMRAGRERFGHDSIAEVHHNSDLSGLLVDATTERVTAEALAAATAGIPVTVRLVQVSEITCGYGQDCRMQPVG